MWQAISHLLREQLGEGEIELRNELPGGEIHAAWHIRYSGRDLFVKCDERELLPIFTAEADQLELLSRSKTVTVPEVLAVGSDRDYSFLVMEYLPARPLDAHNAFILGQQIARLHQWSDQPQFGLDLITISPPHHNRMPGNAAGRPFLPSSVSAGSLNSPPRKASNLATLMLSSSIYSSAWPLISLSLLCCTAICGPITARWAPMGRIYTIRPATGATESATSPCCPCTPSSRHKFMTAISQSPPYRRASSTVSRCISFIP